MDGMQEMEQRGREFYNRLLDEDNRKKMAKQYKFLLLFMAVAILFNVLFSYYVSMRIPGYFSQHDATESFVSLFIGKGIPWLLIETTVFGFLMVIAAYLATQRGLIKYAFTGYIFFTFGSVFIFLHMCGGLSWVPILLGY